MVNVACTPAAWGQVLFERFLDDAAGAGYAGVEASAAVVEGFQRQRGRLRALLEDRRLTLCGVPFEAWFYEKSERKAEMEHLRRLADFLAEVSGQAAVVFRTVRHPARRDMVAGEPPLLPLSRDRMAHLADGLNQYSDLCRDFGLTGAVQNRVGTFLETPDEYRAVADLTEPSLVHLAADLAHWAYAGGDPVELTRDLGSRMALPRLKGFDGGVFHRVREQRLGVRSFLQQGGFTELGGGTLDIEPALQRLTASAYSGWVCVDHEGLSDEPRELAQRSREHLRERLHW